MCSVHAGRAAGTITPPAQGCRQNCSSGNQGGMVQNRDVNMLAGVCLCVCACVCLCVLLWDSQEDCGRKNGVKFLQLFSTLLLSPVEKNKLRFTKICALVSLWLYKTGQENVSCFSMCTQIQMHTPLEGPWPPFHGCLSHILSFRLVWLPAKRWKEDGQHRGTEEETNKASVFFLASVWRHQEVNRKE